ncbi:MAG: DUF507 family protein [Thermodesulfovibrionia bacterium]|nr:DUF507 family protein [Thermodesulfovibrionia bacterium]
MRLSDDKVSHLTHIILKGLKDKDAVRTLSEDGAIRRAIRNVITKELKLAEDIDAKVSNKLQSYSKKVFEGSSEWDVLYQKFYDEEMSKLGRN